ncbi:MAG: hypothetical protein HPY30_15130 [Gammaproteobacteria bacterium (ex Lamellibrachia satsuma)]|nr:MAG: hypothetical protein HPY30_15130 [Gammaproteobacteria bacterium (ex Lamellibrachia satsuma)]
MASEIGSLTKQRNGSGSASWAEGKWHKDDLCAYPADIDAFNDLSKLIRHHVINGHVPKSPVLTLNDNVITLGSCFASELRYFLNDVGLASDSFWVPSGLNNTFALLDFVSWCVRGEQTSRGFRYERTHEGKLEDWQPAYERDQYVDYLRDAGAIVFTIGLAEVWEDARSGKVFWRGIPESVFDENRHVFRVTTVEENKRNIGEIIDLIREVNAHAPIIITLSPVPLKATFRNSSCVTSDCISKSILRVAIDTLMSEERPDVYYWPSFEVVKWVGCHMPYSVYGTDDDVVRHVSRYVILNILFEFIRSYYGEETMSQVQDAYKPSLQEETGSAGEPPKLWRGKIVTA